MYEFTEFRSPSSNVVCYIEVDYLRCDIAEANWSPPPRPGGLRVRLRAGDLALFPAAAPNLSAPATQLRAPDGSPLPYGESITAGVLRCDSAESGITCRDTETGQGFSISREAYQLF